MDVFESSLIFGRLRYFSYKFYSKHIDDEAVFIDFLKASNQHLCPVRVSLGFMGSYRTYRCLWKKTRGCCVGFLALVVQWDLLGPVSSVWLCKA